MRIPRYWTRADGTVTQQGFTYPITACGWSEHTPDEAAAQARERLERIRTRLMEGADLPSWYDYGDRPIREEIVETIDGSTPQAPAGVLTRNAYGAIILNTAYVFFADVDASGNSDSRGARTPASSGGLFAALLGRLFGSSVSRSPDPAHDASQEEQVIAQVQQAIDVTPRAGARLYRTAGGWRIACTHAHFDPCAAETTTLLESLNSDPRYVKLCRAQQCFRARLTPKPWRIGIPDGPPRTFPYASEHQRSLAESWHRTYDTASEQYAVCRLVRTFGTEDAAQDIADILAVHDAWCGVEQPELPLA